MYASSLGLAAFMDWQGGSKTATGVMWFGIGATVGWPFSGILAVPFLVEEFLLATMTPTGTEVWWKFLDGIVRALIVLASYPDSDAPTIMTGINENRVFNFS